MNEKGLYWTGERQNFKGSWQWPQGGIDSGETPREAAWRELREETGLSENEVELVAESHFWLTYEVPRNKPTFFGYRGQAQKWFLFLYKGKDEDAEKLAYASEDFQKVLKSPGSFSISARYLSALGLSSSCRFFDKTHSLMALTVSPTW